jgi:DNA topoisomerase VI subunit B
MPHYRAYLLDPAGGIMAARDIEAETPDLAFEAAATMPHPHAVELWRGAERLGLVTPERRGGAET